MISDDCGWNEVVLLQQFPHELCRCVLVASRLNQAIQNFALVINGAPQIHPLAADRDEHLIHMPSRGWPRPAGSQIPSDCRPELDAPLTEGFVSHFNAAFGEKFLDITQAQP